MSISHKNKVVVVGVGNLLLKDEGIGVHVVRALQETPHPAGVDLNIVDGGTLPDIFLTLEDVDKLIVVDAVKAGGKPGEIYRFRPEDVEQNKNISTSVHEVGLLENLWLMSHSGQGPKDVVIIGIEPDEISWGLELSDKLEERLPRIIEIVINEAGSGEPCQFEKGEVGR